MSDFLNNTSLTAGHYIIIGIIATVIATIILAVLTPVGTFFRKKISKLLNPYPEEAEKRKQLSERIKNKTTTPFDVHYVLHLSTQKFA